MKPGNKDKSAVNKIINELNEGVEHLDAGVERSLRQARAHALQQADKRRNFFSPSGRQWVPAASGLAALFLVFLTVGLWLHGSAPPSLQTTPSEIDYLDIIVDGDNPDLYQDIEFYQWLAHEDQSG
ncbi:MAG TPA: hypothetical protein ENJ30_06830 [Desulfobulbaceae bacterium]|nr:hypothetical protein [Desulfobulbaceae bacterium]